MTGDVIRFPSLPSSISSAQGRAAAERFLQLRSEEQATKAGELLLNQSETLLSLCQLLEARLESTPTSVVEASEFLYGYIEKLSGSSGSFLFDEREYYLGEFALLAGCSCRFLGRRDEARQWFDRAEAWFLLTANVAGDIARLAYQRLALRMEERQYHEVLRLAPTLVELFKRVRATESILKCRFLQAGALKESDRLKEALELFRDISTEAAAIGNERLVGLASVAIIQIHCDLGQAPEALGATLDATPLLRRIDNRVGLAKLQWGLANLLRKQGKLSESVEAFRAAQQEFAEIKMTADVAALHLVIADLLLESGQERQAEWEVRAALPVIDELKMVPEGVAALSLLRESLRRRSINRQALRDLHGYFDDITN